jgi:hypothetical protein
MRFTRSSRDSAVLDSVAHTTAVGPAIGLKGGSTVASPTGTTATISGEPGQSRTVTVTDSNTGRVIGKVETDTECRPLPRL